MKIDIVGISGVIFAVVLMISVVWIKNLYNDIDYYRHRLDVCYREDKSFIVVKYLEDKQSRALTADAETWKIMPRETISIIPESEKRIVGIYIMREN